MEKFTVVAAHGFIKKDGKYLVTRRAGPETNDYMPYLWDIPGGSIDFGEDTMIALKREIKEETGLIININKIIFAYGYLSNPLRHQFQLVYDCDYVEGEVKIDPNEHSEYKWVTLEELKSLDKIAFLDELSRIL